MKFSVFTVIIIRTLLLYTVSCCDPPTKERELKRVRSCMSYWSFYRDNNNPTLQELFHERMKDEICQDENRKHVYLCITHIAGRCPHLLIYWRHVYDPISHICDFQRDFNDSKNCRSHPTFTLMFQACQEEYQKFRSDDEIDCWQYKWHKDCLMAFVEKIDDCNSGSTKPLIDRVLFYHYRHLAAYNRCKYENGCIRPLLGFGMNGEHEKPIPDVGTILAAKNNTINGQ